MSKGTTVGMGNRHEMELSWKLVKPESTEVGNGMNGGIVLAMQAGNLPAIGSGDI
ncbi:hypothetical protein HPP92_007078 [Vanilla planifolia]|uniref:Uncharacterized protein n=1 Tax=Vanilla planifolia TaxID=51239 RepID=A0A835RL54_VANPL|nr:hypothetical protein HPP92_007326 [Vanilla planifolia]KAG0490215.1 hypothetical protein HPP92_007078 [Vanilla planifolia]